MTADFLTDLDVIGHLDWTPGCDPGNEDCGETAVWFLSLLNLCCGTREERFICASHKRHLDLWFASVIRAKAQFKCEACRSAPMTFDLKLVPLRGDS